MVLGDCRRQQINDAGGAMMTPSGHPQLHLSGPLCDSLADRQHDIGRAARSRPVRSPASLPHDLRVRDVRAGPEGIRVIEQLLDAAATLGHEFERGVHRVFLGGGTQLLRGQRMGVVVQVDHGLHISGHTATDIRAATPLVKPGLALFEYLAALSVRTYAEAAGALVAHLRTRNNDHDADLSCSARMVRWMDAAVIPLALLGPCNRAAGDRPRWGRLAGWANAGGLSRR